MIKEDGKLSKVKTYLFPVFGVIIIALLLSAMIFWETSGRELYLYEDVLVFKEDVNRGDKITEEMLTIKKVEKDNMIKNIVLNTDEIINKGAKHFIPANTELHPFYFDEMELITSDNEFIIKIPNDWIYSIPSSLRRKDKVYFYEVSQGAYDSRMNFNRDIDTYNIEEQTELINKFNLTNPTYVTTVAYVKDSSNREVVSIGSEERIDGSSQIAEIETVITPEDLRKLEKAVNNGSKFIIMYSGGNK